MLLDLRKSSIQFLLARQAPLYTVALRLLPISEMVGAAGDSARTARNLFPIVDKASDQPTADVLTQRMGVHEKTAWMLRSLLEESFSFF
jgi:hypothetical protein